MTACVQSVAMFGSELWWKGDHTRGTMGQADELQLLINQEARVTTVCFRTTNLGALSMEAGLRAAMAQLENRQRRFGLRLVSLPHGDQAREIVGAPTAVGRRLTNALAYAGRTENIVLLESPETLDGELVQEEEAEAKEEAEKARPGLTMFTDGSRLDNGAAGYAVVWKNPNGLSWKGIKKHMGYNQEGYDVECAALARALKEAARRNTTPERIMLKFARSPSLLESSQEREREREKRNRVCVIFSLRGDGSAQGRRVKYFVFYAIAKYLRVRKKVRGRRCYGRMPSRRTTSVATRVPCHFSP